MKNILNTSYLYIHQIICDSITSSKFTQCYKQAISIHILKKPTLDTSVLLNYRSIYQLLIISKFLESYVNRILNIWLQITSIIPTNLLSGPSINTSLNMVTNSILKSLDDNHLAQLLLLGLTSAFDTILHENLCVRLADIGISNNAIVFIKSYLADRSYSVVIDECGEYDIWCSTG